MIKTIKEIHSKDICLFKIGTFYHAYGRDAYILSYIFGYKIKDLEKKYKECGFPTTAIAKVCAKLESNKINYLIIDRRNNYEVDEKEDYKNLNRYTEFYEKANKYVNCKKRIDTIAEFLMENIETKNITKVLSEMEEIMYERREISYEANVTENIELKKNLLNKIISKIKVIDFLLNLSYDKKLITEKKYYKLGQRLDDIIEIINTGYG